MISARLLGEGASDEVLLRPLAWMLDRLTPTPVEVLLADLSLAHPRPSTLEEKIATAAATHQFDLLFVHRDADRRPPEVWREQIRGAAGQVRHVAVVPVQSTEAWLLFHEQAIREAAGNRSGRCALGLPGVARIEEVGDPKIVLAEALRIANDTAGRHRRRFDVAAARLRIADLIDDWSPLRALPAFQQLERDTRFALAALGLPLSSGG